VFGSGIDQLSASFPTGVKVEYLQALVNAGYDPHDVLETVGLPDMDVVEKATQAPALPPAWVPAPPAEPAAPDAEPAPAGPPAARESITIRATTPPDDMKALVRRVLSDGYQPVELGSR